METGVWAVSPRWLGERLYRWEHHWLKKVGTRHPDWDCRTVLPGRSQSWLERILAEPHPAVPNDTDRTPDGSEHQCERADPCVSSKTRLQKRVGPADDHHLFDLSGRSSDNQLGCFPLAGFRSSLLQYSGNVGGGKARCKPATTTVWVEESSGHTIIAHLVDHSIIAFPALQA